MRLTELEPSFLEITSQTTRRYHDNIKKADGMIFLCPLCFERGRGKVGCHAIICWQPHVAQSFYPIPGRWSFVGTGYDDLTLVAHSSSIFLNGEGSCGAHFFIKNGNIE